VLAAAILSALVLSGCDGRPNELARPEAKEAMNLKRALLIFGFPVMLAMTMPLYAPPGFGDLGDGSTILLALVGAAGVMAAKLREK
jgi:hypothetical protein